MREMDVTGGEVGGNSWLRGPPDLSVPRLRST